MLFDDFDNKDDAPDEDDASIPIESEFSQPRARHHIIGQEEIETALHALFSKKRHPHALIFSGPKGVGKATMAYRLARHLLKSGEDGSDMFSSGNFFTDPEPAVSTPTLAVHQTHPVFLKVAAASHADLLTVERIYDEKKQRHKSEIGVEEIRKIAPFMRKTAAVDGGWRIAIVDDADMMNRNAQNALLKILEEPPEKAVLILVTHRLGALLPTILSRASVVSFPEMKKDEIHSAMKTVNPRLSDTDREIVTAMAEGSLGRVLSYAGESSFPTIRETLDLLATWPEFDWVKLQFFAENMAKASTPESQQAFRDTIAWTVARLARSAATGEALPAVINTLSHMRSEVSLAGWLQICDTLNDHFDHIQTAHLDRKYMVIGAFTIFGQHG